MNDLTITVRGQSKPTPRLEAAIRWKGHGRGRVPFIHTYTPDTADAWKANVRAAFAPHWPAEPWAGPVTLDITLYLPRLAEQYEPGWPRGAFPCIAASMGDWDNLGKAISDALNPVKEKRTNGFLKSRGEPGLWLDDRQVFDARVRKFHAGIGYAPGALIVATHHVTADTQLTFNEETHAHS